MDESGISLGFDVDDISESLIDEILQRSPPDMETLNFYEIRSRPAPVTASPSFKTEVVKSRTQFKQQLMRDQLQKERDRKKLSDSSTKKVSDSTNSSKVPVNIQNVELPQHVLLVKTGLQNPTRYHILEKQRNQVLEYLSSSQQDGDSFSSAHASNVSSAPSTYRATRTQLRPSSSYTVSRPEPSPGVASVASGGTSDAEEVIEGILSYEESSLASEGHSRSLYGSNASLEKARDTSSCPTGMITVKQEYDSYEDPNRDRMKKDTHNMIERRRRYNINDRIKELGDLLPQKNDTHFNFARDSRSNKGTILKASVDFIKALKEKAHKAERLEQAMRAVQSENRQLLLKIQQLELNAQSNGVEVVAPTWKVQEPTAIINQYIRPGPRANIQMPDVLSEAVYVQYDESMEEVSSPDPMLTAATLLPQIKPNQNMDFE